MSQEALRKRFAGIQGRNLRQRIAQIKGGLSQREQALEEYKEGLDEYSQQVSQSETNLQEYDVEKAAYDKAQKILLDNRAGAYLQFGDDPRVKKYLEPYAEQQQMNAQTEYGLNQAVAQYNEGVPLEQAFKNFNVDYMIKRGYLKFEQANDPQIRQEAAMQSNLFLSQNTANPIVNLARTLPRTEQVQVNARSAYRSEMIPLVSAKNLNSSNASASYESNVPTGMASGDNLGTAGQSQSGNRTGGWLSRLIGNTQEAKEVARKQAEKIIQYGDLAIINGQPYNLTTGRQINVVTATPSFSQQYAKLRAEQGNIKGTLALVGSSATRFWEKANVISARKFGNVAAYKGEESIGVLASATASNAPYLIPFAGQALLVGGAAEDFITKAGRRRLSASAQSLQEKGYGKGTSNVLAYSVPLVSGGLGAIGLKAEVSRGLRYPKYDTRFLAKQTLSRELPEGEQMIYRGAALTREKNLLSSKRYLSGFDTDIRLGRSVDDVQSYAAGTRGVVRKLNLFGKASPPRKFGAAELGEIKSTDLDLLAFRNKAIEMRRPVEGFVGRAVGKAKADKGDVSYFASMFAGGKIDEARGFALNRNTPIERNIWDASKVNKIPRRGRGQGLGIVEAKEQNVFDDVFFSSGGVQKRINTKALAEQRSKSIVENILGQKAATRQARDIFFGKVGRAVSKGLSMKAKTTQQTKSSFDKIVGLDSFAQVQQTKTDSRQRVISKVKHILKERTRQKEGSISGLAQALGFGTIAKDTQKFNLGYKVGLNTRQDTRQRTKQKQKQQQDSFFNPSSRESGRGGTVVYTSSKGDTKGKVARIGEDYYVVFVRRYGVDQIVGTSSTLGEAKRILRNNLTGSLAASGYIGGGSGKKQDISDLFGSMFTSSKKDSFRVVQRRGKRLSSRSEVNEIWGFNRRKGKAAKKIKWW